MPQNQEEMIYVSSGDLNHRLRLLPREAGDAGRQGLQDCRGAEAAGLPQDAGASGRGYQEGREGGEEK